MSHKALRPSVIIENREITPIQNVYHELETASNKTTDKQKILCHNKVAAKDKENQPPCNKRRERNILSSRKYRAKRRERMRNLDEINKQLSLQIQGMENEIETMKRVIYNFVGHASECEECGILQIKFEED